MELPVVISIVSLIISVLMSIVMFFAKIIFNNVRETLRDHQRDINNIKDSYIKKEDFREFKEELFVRLDEMKLDFKREVERLQK